jgi:hypothetical protein
MTGCIGWATVPLTPTVNGTQYECAVVSDGEIPQLSTAKMSDWIDIRTDVEPAAAGDGVQDDTRAIQAALDRLGEALNEPKVVYLPPGTYRITQTLSLAKVQGMMLIGHGRDTVLAWDGARDGVMFHSNGVSRSVIEGLIWDGRDMAGVGIDHASRTIYETRVLHQHLTLRNFRIAGIRTGYEQEHASAEMMFYNLHFSGNSVGAQFLAWNDYNNVFDGCLFEDNGWGISAEKGNVIVRNSNFARSTKGDMFLSTHSHPASDFTGFEALHRDGARTSRRRELEAAGCNGGSVAGCGGCSSQLPPWAFIAGRYSFHPRSRFGITGETDEPAANASDRCRCRLIYVVRARCGRAGQERTGDRVVGVRRQRGTDVYRARISAR